MPDRHLKTYLQDHLAGSEAGVRLARLCISQNRDHPAGDFARRLLRNLEADRVILMELLDRLQTHSAPVRRGLSLMSGILSHLKLRGFGATAELSRFETLEALVVLITGRRSLWRAMEVVAERDRRLRDLPFAGLAHRAKQDQDEAEAHRLALARTVFEAGGEASRAVGGRLRRLLPILGT